MAKHPLQILQDLGEIAHMKQNPPNKDAEEDDGMVSTGKNAGNKKLSGNQVAAIKSKSGQKQIAKTGNSTVKNVMPKAKTVSVE